MVSTNYASILISTAQELKDFISTISASNSLYIDLEGKNLGRNGTICIVSILVYSEKVVRLDDVTTLGTEAFTITGANGKTIKSILENNHIQKCIWDVRNDADALFSLYQVCLACVTDIQLLENATRTSHETYLCGLPQGYRI